MKQPIAIPLPTAAGGPSAFHKLIQAENIKRLAQHDAHLAKVAQPAVVLPNPAHPLRKPKLVVPGLPNQAVSKTSVPPMGY